jgi:hypothetical protein
MLEMHPVRTMFKLCASPEHNARLRFAENGLVDSTHSSSVKANAQERLISVFANVAGTLHSFNLTLLHAPETSGISVAFQKFIQCDGCKFDPAHPEKIPEMKADLTHGFDVMPGFFLGTTADKIFYDPNPESPVIKLASCDWKLLTTVDRFNRGLQHIQFNKRGDEVARLKALYEHLVSADEKRKAIDEIIPMNFRSDSALDEKVAIGEWIRKELELIAPRA